MVLDQLVSKHLLTSRLNLLLLLLFLCSCVSVEPALILTRSDSQKWQKGRSLVVLIDEDYPIYEKIIIGIHVASGGNYIVIKTDDNSLKEAALFEHLVELAPHGIIALGPRSANAVVESKVLIPAVFAMIPRIENYDLDGAAFIAGIRMNADEASRIDLMAQILPELKSVGLVYSKQYSRLPAETLRVLFESKRFTMLDIEVKSLDDVLPALNRMKNDYDAILMMEDPLMLENEIITLASGFLMKDKKSFIAIDCSMVAEGALVAFGIDYFSLGQELFSLIKDAKPEDIYQKASIINSDSLSICFNIKTAKTLGLSDNVYLLLLEYLAKRKIPLRIFD